MIYYQEKNGRKIIGVNFTDGIVTEFEQIQALEKGEDVQQVEVKKPLAKNKIVGGKMRLHEEEKKGRGLGVRHCKVCGEVGHRSDGCPKNGTAKDEDVDINGFEVTPRIKDAINDMLLAGEGTKEVSEYYNITRFQANRAIAAAKGIKLP